MVKNKIKTDEKPKPLSLILSGLLIGAVNGLLGSGGGMVAVPVLELLLKKETKTAHATALLIILPVTLISSIIYIVNGEYEWKSGLASGLGVIFGGVIGALLLAKLSDKRITFIFSALMLAAGVKLLFF